MTMPALAPVSAARWRRAIGLRLALAALVVSTVGCTALVIHLTWSWTARRNVADIVGQLNAQISGSVRREVQGVVAATLALQRRSARPLPPAS
jgi:hypothetical protein